MNLYLTMILMAGSITVLFWALFQWMTQAMDGEKRKLQARLSGETRAIEIGQSNKALLRETDVSGFSGKLVEIPKLREIYRRLELAWPQLSLPMFCNISVGLFVITAIVTWAFTGSMIMALGGGALAGSLPFIMLNARVNRRNRMLNDELPEALDFLSRILRAGHSLSTGLQMMSEELPQPLASEFRRCYDAHSLGQALEDSLRDTSVRIGSADFGFFVTAVLIQRQTGGDLAEVLTNISDMIRGRIRLQQHVKAKTAEGRFTGYILTAFPGVMFVISYILNPAYASTLLTGQGVYLLGVAFGLCMLGLYAIRKITQIRV